MYNQTRNLEAYETERNSQIPLDRVGVELKEK